MASHHVHKDTKFGQDPITYANLAPKIPRRKTPFLSQSPPKRSKFTYWWRAATGISAVGGRHHRRRCDKGSEDYAFKLG